MGSNLTPKLVSLLTDAGCSFVRKGKGDHAIWRSPITNKHFPVDATIKSRHTANAVLKQAGLPKAF
jgi:HicA toxin of bacterial toxin-antitoxin,